METKHCPKCKLSLPTTDFYTNKYRKDGLATACKECHKQENREYRARHPARVYKKELMAKLAIKMEVFSHYSGGEPKCIRCGFSDMRALTIDHVNGDGAEQRRSISEQQTGGVPYYRWIRDNNYPDDLQILCWNCQWIKRHENQEHNAYGRKKKAI